jgi:hypothetical protein
MLLTVHFLRLIRQEPPSSNQTALPLAMSSSVFVCQIHLCLRLVVPRVASRDQHAAVKWFADPSHRWSWSQLRGSIIDSRDRRPLLLALIVGVPTPMVRANQGKCVHFVVSGSLDISITGTPIEDAVYD